MSETQAITRDELVNAAMTAPVEVSIPAWKARRLFARALDNRALALDSWARPVSPQVNGEEAITREELGAALKRMGYAGLHAPDIMKNVIEHRERRFEPGDIVTSAIGKVYILDEDRFWTCPSERTGRVYVYNAPARPLTKIGVAV